MPTHEPTVIAMTASEIRSLEQLLAAARNDTDESGRVAGFLLSWWDAEKYGAWNPTDLWAMDQALSDATMVVLGYINRSKRYPDTLGFGPDFEVLANRWRG